MKIWLYYEFYYLFVFNFVYILVKLKCLAWNNFEYVSKYKYIYICYLYDMKYWLVK